MTRQKDDSDDVRRMTRREFLGTAAGLVAAPLIPPVLTTGCATAPQAKISPPPEDSKRADALDEALEILKNSGPEFAGGLANHGPMAAEALVALGRLDAVVPWTERYKYRLNDPIRPSGRKISPGDWRGALGDPSRMGDWIAFFNRELDAAPWRKVLAEWLPRLTPGLVAVAFHGAIRVGHAARSLSVRENALRKNELAQGLGYWAARFVTLPGEADKTGGSLKPSQALRRVEKVPVEKRVRSGFITERMRPLQTFAPFAKVGALVDAGGDPSSFLADVTETFAGLFLAENGRNVITFVHSVTGPSAVRLLAPHLDPKLTADVMRSTWRAAASTYAAFASTDGVASFQAPRESREDLIDRAVSNGDEHAIKFTEACLREHAVNPKPVYLAAIRQALEWV